MAEIKYEYLKTPLKGLQGKYISIPFGMVVDEELDIKGVSIFAYLRIHCGLNDIVNFTIPDIIEWCGGKPDKRTNGLNDKYLNALDKLVDMGYLTYLNKKSKSGYIKCKFNTDYYYEECANGYSSVYLDEVEKIMQYKRKNTKDNMATNINVFLVFAYLRHKIIRRPNELKPEERSIDKIKDRKKRLPEAYDGYINDIAAEIGLSAKTVSRIIDILEQELRLIVTDRAFRVRNNDGEFRTLPIIFANAYKRETSYLLLTEENYSRLEIEAKANKMKNYKINKNKRKNK